MKRTLRAVFFDIDDTLYSTTAFAARARKAAVEAMIKIGLRIPLKHGLRELEEAIAEFGSNYEHHYEKWLDRLPFSAVRGLNRAIVIAAGIAAYHDAKFKGLRPFPDVLPALRRLGRLGLVLGAVSDGLALKQAEKLIRLGVQPLLNPRAIFISDQIGIAKPNPKLYLRACEETGVRPGEAIMVGDHPVKDVDAAAEAGLITVRVARGGKHDAGQGRRRPHFSVQNFNDLLTIVGRDFIVPPSR